MFLKQFSGDFRDHFPKECPPDNITSCLKLGCCDLRRHISILCSLVCMCMCLCLNTNHWPPDPASLRKEVALYLRASHLPLLFKDPFQFTAILSPVAQPNATQSHVASRLSLLSYVVIQTFGCPRLMSILGNETNT
eukprot:1526770-Amphidinium_carterae.1